MNRKILQLFLFLLPISLTAQPQLSREQMREDYDFLVKIIKETYPQMEVIRLVTGKDILPEIEGLRSSIDTITAFSSYYKLVQRALALTQELHHHIIYCEEGDGLCEPENYYLNDSILKQSVWLAKKIMQSRNNEWNYGKPPLMGLYYINGQYYFMRDLMSGDDRTVVICSKGSRVLKINGMDIDRYILDVAERLGSSLRWDIVRRKYYTKADMRMNRNDTVKLTLELPDGTVEERYLVPGQRLFYQGKERDDDYDPKVLYFDSSKLLYIRIPEMDMGLWPFYEEEIVKMKHQPIDRVVIDIRGNDGGSDRVWKQTLSAIIDTSFSYSNDVLFKNTPTIISYFNRIRNEMPPLEQTNDIIIGRDTLFRWPDQTIITPTTNTLAFKGTIYVLGDERCYSSTKAFLSACNKIDRLVSVGQPIGRIAGTGTTPFVFALPWSNLIFRINVSLEAANSNNPVDYYDRLEIPVEKTLQEAIFEANWKGERYSEDFLFNHDPVFQKVLEQKE